MPRKQKRKASDRVRAAASGSNLTAQINAAKTVADLKAILAELVRRLGQ